MQITNTGLALESAQPVNVQHKRLLIRLYVWQRCKKPKANIRHAVLLMQRAGSSYYFGRMLRAGIGPTVKLSKIAEWSAVYTHDLRRSRYQYESLSMENNHGFDFTKLVQIYGVTVPAQNRAFAVCAIVQ